MKKAILCSTAFFSLVGCSSAKMIADRPTPETQPDVVISRIDDLSARPKWLHESNPFSIENGKVVCLGSTTIPDGDRLEAAYRIARNNAKNLIASSIAQRLDFVLQNAEEGTAIDADQVHYIGEEASSLTTNSLRPGHIYWEKYSTTLDTGERVTRYRVFATVTMPESDFKTAIFNAIRTAQAQGSISADFKKKVDARWDQFVGNPNPQASTQSNTDRSVSSDN